MSALAWLVVAISTEIVATVSLKASDGFRHPLPVVVMAIGYLASFYALAATVRVLPLGLVYAVWSGVGTVGAVLAGRLIFGERLGLPQLVGIAVVIAGVVLLNVGRVAE